MEEIKWTPEQRAAIEADKMSVFVSAAAGSGKTKALTARIIERICSPNVSADLSKMLIVTFTNEAANELLSRIGKALEEAVIDNPGDKRIYRQLLLLPSAHISTIDSFFLDLIKANAQILGLPSDLRTPEKVAEDKIRADILEDLIFDYYAGEVPAQYAISDFPRFVSIFGSGSKDDVLAQTANDYYDMLCNLPAGIDSLRDYIASYDRAKTVDFLQTPWGKTVAETVKETIAHFTAVFGEALSYIDEHPEYSPYAAGFSQMEDYLKTFDAAREEYGYYQSFLSAVSVPTLKRLKSGTEKTRGLKYYTSVKDDYGEAIKNLQAKYFCFSSDDILQSCEKTEQALRDLYRFLTLFDERFAEEKRNRHLITFTDMKRYALALLWDREHDAQTDIARSVSALYDEIYVDECQDTDAVQQKIFSLISREDNFFSVGDIKQSIYGFRGARPELFSDALHRCEAIERDNEKEKILPITGKRGKVFLSANFRSTRCILEYANGVFDVLMNAGNRHGYEKGDRLICGSNREGVPVEMIVATQAEKKTDGISAEAEAVASRIASLLGQPKSDGEPIRPCDIAILLRSAKDHAIPYANALKRRGIPYYNDEPTAFFENPEVVLAFSLLSTVDNPAKDVYLAAALKSPLYGVTMEELLYIRRQKPDMTLWQALCDYTQETGFSKGKQFIADHERWHALSYVLPCDVLIWRIYCETGILALSLKSYNCLSDVQYARTNLMQLYRWAGNYAAGKTDGLHAFLSFLEEAMETNAKPEGIYTPPADAVRILTIHKSKGLEYPVCFLCDTGHSVKIRNTGKQEKGKSTEKKAFSFDARLGLSPKLASEDGFSMLETPFSAASALAEEKRTAFENVRLLYVALTRAKERLFITAEKKPKKDEILSETYNTEEAEERLFAKRDYSLYSLFSDSDFMNMLLNALPQSPTFRLSVAEEAEEAEETSSESTEVSETADFLPVEAERAARRLSFSYPYADCMRIPSKLSVSNLYPSILDEETGAVLKNENEESLSLPKFMQKIPDETVTAAERGTAMHTFMQFFDLAYTDAHGVPAEIDRLIEKKLLFPGDREKINVKKLQRFFESDIAQQMRTAAHVYREKRFLVSYPASAFTTDKVLAEKYKGQDLLVQGIMDCVLSDEKGDITLIDYKTDSFPRNMSRAEIERTLKERHREQLMYYRYACRKLFGAPVKHTIIYSFALDAGIELD